MPILVLSARSGSQDKIAALDLGAVDYVTKPFDMNELIVRLRSAIHRSGIESDALQVTLGNVDIDLSARTARRAALCDEWRRWDPGLQLRVLPSPHRNLVAPVVGYVRSQLATGREVTVLLAEVQPRKRRQRILHNQRGLILAAALRSRTDAVVATVSYRLR